MARSTGKRNFFRKLADYASTFILLMLIALAAAYFGKIGEQEYQGRFIVMDGDSLELDGTRFRLEGIDAPEAKQICRRLGEGWPCGREATRYLRSLISQGSVRCRSLGFDKYERVLANCSSGPLDINREMVANGWAVSFGGYFSAEAEAKASRLGIWAGEFDRPGDWRQTHGDVLEINGSHTLVDSMAARMRMIWNWLLR